MNYITALTHLGIKCQDPNGFYPHPTDCEKYYQCGGGIPYEYSCSSGTLWNDQLKNCDYNVQCSSESVTSESTTKSSTIEQITTTTSVSVITNGESASCLATICGKSTSEPISEEVRSQRDAASCTLDNASVEAIEPLRSSNPQNVKNVEAIFPESTFNQFFPDRHAAYTYSNFLKAIGKYPSICKTTEHCPRILANMFGHIQQETANLVYIEEINKSAYCADWSAWVVEAYPCVSGQMYYGRGAKQLSWNYNYGAFSNAMFGDSMVLLNNPDLVATTWLNFAASMWFYVTPQPPKPSMLQVLDGSWIPNAHDLASNLVAGFGVTTMIIIGAIECGSGSQQAQNRANYYTEYAKQLGVDISGEKLLCNDMQQFSKEGSAGGIAMYWAPEIQCSLVTWQTAYSALIEGDYSKCKGISPDCSSSETTSFSSETSTTMKIESTTRMEIESTTGTKSTTMKIESTSRKETESTTTMGSKSTTTSIPVTVTTANSEEGKIIVECHNFICSKFKSVHLKTETLYK